MDLPKKFKNFWVLKMKVEGPIIVNGKRPDGRRAEETREIEMRINIVPNANGSSLVRFGKTTIVCSVYGPKMLFPKHLQDPEKGTLRVRYNMAPFSVDERKPPSPSRRSIELSKIIRIAVIPSIFLKDFPRSGLDIFVEVLQADGSTRVSGINAASLALASAGIPMKDLVTACSVGKVDETLIVDLNGIEDNNCQADISFAMMVSKNKITLLQMDGLLTKEEILQLLKMAKETCKKIYEIQKKTLKNYYEELVR
ncbi:MAG: exosome complex exonuclease Rrp41 [Candidatus Aenigmarchaeota archaeon]|nr:exosome complex exonuclease Rrp41 [Candidatus Aenigmarchaeota archaeon]